MIDHQHNIDRGSAGDRVILMSELVEDPTYWEFLQTKPELPEISRDKRMMLTAPWVVYVQREAEGKWGKREFWKYSKALKFLERALAVGVHDAALNCRRIGFDPPSRFVRIKGKFVKGSDGKRRQATKRVYWKPRLPADEADHHWCKYCRRPTVFKYFSTHKRLGKVDTTVPRCCICGASARIALPAHDRMYRK